MLLKKIALMSLRDGEHINGPSFTIVELWRLERARRQLVQERTHRGSGSCDSNWALLLQEEHIYGLDEIYVEAFDAPKRRRLSERPSQRRKQLFHQSRFTDVGFLFSGRERPECEDDSTASAQTPAPWFRSTLPSFPSHMRHPAASRSIGKVGFPLFSCC
jgi:hypothetical protein